MAGADNSGDDGERPDFEDARFIEGSQIAIMARTAALTAPISDEIAQRIARLVYATAALCEGESTAVIKLKIHDTARDGGQLRSHGEFGICLACIKIDTPLGHACASIAPGSQLCCLHPLTLVARADGSWAKAVDVLEGAALLTFDPESRATRVARVTQVMKNHIRNHHHRINGQLLVTGDHPILTSGGWVRAEDLSVGATMVGRDGPVPVNSLEYVAGDVATVYIRTDTGSFLAGSQDAPAVVHGDYVAEEILRRFQRDLAA